MLYLLINNPDIVKEFFGEKNLLAELMELVQNAIKKVNDLI